MRKAVIFTAPSGSGKTTLVRHLLACIPSLAFSVSATTRLPRQGEVNGRDYYFLSGEDFRKKISAGEFAEWEEVYSGAFYGTLKSEIEKIWANGQDVIFDVEVHGAQHLKSYFQDQALAVFVKVPSLKILHQRLESRKTETLESLTKRVEKAEYELTFEPQFDTTVVNDDLDRAKEEALRIVKVFLA